MATLNLLQRTCTALNQAQYLTDLNVQVVEGKKVLALCWYAQIPLLGRLVSYICYCIYEGQPIQQALKEILDQHQQELNLSVANILLQNPETFSNQIYDSSVKLGHCYDRFTALTGQGAPEKSRLNYSQVLPMASPSNSSHLVGDLSALCNKVSNIHRATLFYTQSPTEELRTQLIERYRSGQKELKALLCDFVKFAEEVTEDLAIAQIDVIYQRLQEIKRQLHLEGDPAQDWINFDQLLETEKGSFWEFKESELIKARRMGKLAIKLISCGSVAQSFYNQLCGFVGEYRKRFKVNIKDYICHSAKESELQKLKALYQKIDKITSQTYQIGRLLKVSANINRTLFDLENIFVDPAFSRAKSQLRKFSNDPKDLILLTRLDQLIQELNPTLQGQSKKIAQRVTDIAQTYLALQAAEKKAGMTVSELKTRAMHLKNKNWTYLEKFEEAEEILQEIQRLQGKIADLAPFVPHLMRHLQGVLKEVQGSLDFPFFPEDAQLQILRALSYEKLEKVVKKYPQTEKMVERVLAQRVPGVVAAMIKDLREQIRLYFLASAKIVDSLSKRIRDYRDGSPEDLPQNKDLLLNAYIKEKKSLEQALSKKDVVCEKLLQMHEEALTQVPPQDLTQAMDYLKKQQEVLVLALSLIEPVVFKNIALSCTPSYITGKNMNKTKKVGQGCSCEIHRALKKSLLLSRYYKMMRSHDTKLFKESDVVREMFDVLLECDPMKAANLLLRMPRGTPTEISTVKSYLLKIKDKTTSQGGQPLAKLPTCPEKQQLLNLASRLFDDTPLAELAEELDLPWFKEKTWKEIDSTIVSQFHEFKKSLSPFEMLQLRDAAAWIMRSPHFIEKEPLLVAHCKKIYELLAPNILSLPLDLLSYIYSYETAASHLIVSKEWNSNFAVFNARKTPLRFSELVNGVQEQLESYQVEEILLTPVVEKLKGMNLKPLKNVPENIEEVKVFVQSRLKELVYVLSPLPRSHLKKLDITPFHTNYLLFGKTSPKPGDSCLVKKSFKESRVWNWYNATKPSWPGANPANGRFDIKGQTRRRLQLLAETAPEAVLDCILNNPASWFHENCEEMDALLRYLISLSRQQHPSSCDPFAIFPPSDKKDIFLQDMIRRRENILSGHDILHIVDAIQNRGLKELALIGIASGFIRLGIDPLHLDQLDPTKEKEALALQCFQKMKELGGDIPISKTISFLVNDSDGGTIAGKSLVMLATQIPDGTIRDQTLKRLLSNLKDSSVSVLEELVLALEFIHDKAQFGLDLFIFIIVNKFKLKNPRALLRYIVDENYRKAAETILNVELPATT